MRLLGNTVPELGIVAAREIGGARGTSLVNNQAVAGESNSRDPATDSWEPSFCYQCIAKQPYKQSVKLYPVFDATVWPSEL